VKLTICMKTVMLCVAALAATAPLASQAAPVSPPPLENHKSGISVSLSGANGIDWAIERTCHDASIADQIVYLKAHVQVSLRHNERNTLMMHTPKVERVLGANGPDGQADTGDEGAIHYKIDRDMQAHAYCSQGSALPPWAPEYTGPFRFDALTYDGSQPVLGSVGDNGETWGTSPGRTTKRFAYGQHDEFGNEWHTLTYWDDDIPVYTKLGISPHRQGASDGHCLFVCVNPLTPVIQFSAPDGEQFYTTPVKTYHVPRIWPQTTYLTGGVRVSFTNLTNDEPVFYRVGDGDYVRYDGESLTARELLSGAQSPALLQVKCGRQGTVLRRAVVLDPPYPAPAETHGYLLWADEAGRRRMADRLHSVEPFKASYKTFRSSYYQGANADFSDVRGGWRATASEASRSLSNAIVIAAEAPGVPAEALRLCKQRLLRLARLQPVGFELTVSAATPAKDFLNELGQTLQQFADAGLAYDILSGFARATEVDGGITPIEEIIIRDGLAKIAKSILQFRGNYSATSGGGDSHWSHGYELALASIALAMPTYATPYYGVSGADRKTVNDLKDEAGEFWNPFPHQGVTWYDAATDPTIATPGHPDVVNPFAAEFIYSDDGYWTGANDLQAEGNRYFKGPNGNRLVDVKYGGLANAEGRVELVEMSGYESPFVTRTYVVDLMRRLRGDANTAPAVQRYIRRRVVGGVVRLKWDESTGTYAPQPPAVAGLTAFNRHYPFASVPAAKQRVADWLGEVKAYYTGAELPAERRKSIADNERKWLYDAYNLALCEAPDELPQWTKGVNGAPLLKPMFKYVVKPGTHVVKHVIAMDPDGDPVSLSVSGLPKGAVFDATAARITWTPDTSDAGVHIVQVTAHDGTAQTTRPFPIIVKMQLGVGPVPPAPASLTARVVDSGSGVELAWEPPPGGAAIAGYAIYRDGVLWATADAETRRLVDRDLIEPGSRTRYHVACYSTRGGESTATTASPANVYIPKPEQ